MAPDSITRIPIDPVGAIAKPARIIRRVAAGRPLRPAQQVIGCRGDHIPCIAPSGLPAIAPVESPLSPVRLTASVTPSAKLPLRNAQ